MPTSLPLQLDLWWKKLAWPGTLSFNSPEYLTNCQTESKPLAQTVNLPARQGTRVWSLCWEDPLEKGMATHSSILVWRIPWTEEPGGIQSMGSQRIGHDWETNTSHSLQITWGYCLVALGTTWLVSGPFCHKEQLASRNFLVFLFSALDTCRKSLLTVHKASQLSHSCSYCCIIWSVLRWLWTNSILSCGICFEVCHRKHFPTNGDEHLWKSKAKLFYSTPFPLFPLFKGTWLQVLLIENKPVVTKVKVWGGIN